MSTRPSDDELARAVERLQTFARKIPREASETRARVLAGEAVRGRVRARIAWIVAGMLVLFGGPAFAHFTGVVDLVPEWLTPDRAASSTERRRSSQARRAPAEATPTPRAPVEPPASPSAVLEPTSIAPHTEPTAGTRKSRPAKKIEGHPTDTRELYRLAHAAHFSGGDPESALRAWNVFLAAAPSDTFAPEARYNRAILLVKLERYGQALDALAPFACAPNGAYRQREARALIEHLRAHAPQLEAPACMREGVP